MPREVQDPRHLDTAAITGRVVRARTQFLQVKKPVAASGLLVVHLTKGAGVIRAA